VKAAEEVGWARMARFGLMTLAMIPYRVALVPPLRAGWLRLLGARVGRRVVMHDVRFFNLYRRGLSGLVIGEELRSQHLHRLCDPIVIIGTPSLTRRYELALQLLDVRARAVGSEATWSGSWAIAKAIAG